MAHVGNTPGQLAWADGVDTAIAALQTDVTNPTVTGIQRGTQVCTAISGTIATTVTYPTPYAGGVVPIVVATLAVTAPGTRNIGISAVNNTGFTINLLSVSTTSVPVNWIAVAP